MLSRSPELVIHCGDIISPPVLTHFSPLPMRFVFGNNDGERAGLTAKCSELGFGEIDDTLELEMHGKKLFAYHGTSFRTLSSYIESQKYDYIFTGHTHEVRDEVVGKTRIVNPGALFAASRYTIAELDVPTGAIDFIEIER